MGYCAGGFIAGNDFEGIGPAASSQWPSAINVGGCTGVLIGANNFTVNNIFLPIDASGSSGVFITPQAFAGAAAPLSGRALAAGSAYDLFAFGMPAGQVKDTPNRGVIYFQNGDIANYGYSTFDMYGTASAAWPRNRYFQAGTDEWEIGMDALDGNANFALYNPSLGKNAVLVATATNNVGIGTTSPAAQLQVAKAMVAGVNNVAYSTAPLFDLSLGNIQQFSCTGTGGSIISPTVKFAGSYNLVPGQMVTIIFVQNASTACSISWPSNVIGGRQPSSTLSSVNIQQFVVSNNGSTLYATDLMISWTGGTP
jgi:hypothetical protein